MSVVKELREFMMRGNVIDLAVGVIIGGAFGQIVTSLVNDIIMPPIGVLLNGVDFKALKFVIKEASVNAAGVAMPEVTINYGNFIQIIINFVIVATAIFFVIKAMNQLQKKKEETAVADPVPTQEETLLAEIRDLLKNK